MPRALLINPWITDFAAYDLWACPLGLLGLGGLLRAGCWDVDYLDFTDRHHPAIVERRRPERGDHSGKYFSEPALRPEAVAWVPLTWRRYGLPPDVAERELAARPRPDVMLVTSRMTYWHPGVTAAIAAVRRQWPDVPVALGGVYATLCPDHARRTSGADVVIEGEAEPRLDEILRALTGRGLALPPELAGRDLRDLDALPMPAHDLHTNPRAAAIETSRGCPYRCTYCSSGELVPRFRRKSTEKILAEIEWLVERRGVEDIAFYDDALLLDVERHFLPLADAVAARRWPVRFHTPNGLFTHMITPRVAGAMRAMGMETVRLSLESASPERLAALNRRILPGHFLDAMRCLREAGFRREQIGVYILAALPGQPLAEVREAVDLVIEAGGTPRISEYSPIPKTPEFTRAAAASAERLAAMSLPSLADEPLLTNNTIYYMIGEEFAPEELWALKNYARAAARGESAPVRV